MVVRERRMNLRQGQMSDAVTDLLGSQSELVPTYDPLNRHTRSSYARTAAADLRIAADQRANIDRAGHKLDCNANTPETVPGSG